MEILAIILFLIISFISSGFEASYLRFEKEASLQKDNAFISTTLFINTLANNFGAIFFAIFLDNFKIEQNIKPIIEIVLFTSIILIFCETLPKSIAFYYPQIFYNKSLKFFYWNVSLLFSPILNILNKIFPQYLLSEKILSLKDILLPLKIIIEKEFWRKNKSLVIQEIISFIRTDISTFLKPCIEVEMVNYESKVGDVIKIFKSTNYRRFPVYKDSRNNIVGLIDVSDLINKNPQESILNYIKEVPVLIDSYRAFDFLKSNHEFAVVYDEFGNFLGIVSRKEILKNIFNIYTPNVRKISKNTYIIESPIDLGLIEELTGIHLGEPNKNLNEFLMEKRKIVEEGDEFTLGNLKITILSKEGNYISRIKLELL
ncbi:MAG: CBS domain-containing protein [candidate division WOR-3 bacterium]